MLKRETTEDTEKARRARRDRPKFNLNHGLFAIPETGNKKLLWP